MTWSEHAKSEAAHLRRDLPRRSRHRPVFTASFLAPSRQMRRADWVNYARGTIHFVKHFGNLAESPERETETREKRAKTSRDGDRKTAAIILQRQSQRHLAFDGDACRHKATAKPQAATKSRRDQARAGTARRQLENASRKIRSACGQRRRSLVARPSLYHPTLPSPLKT